MDQFEFDKVVLKHECLYTSNDIKVAVNTIIVKVDESGSNLDYKNIFNKSKM